MYSFDEEALTTELSGLSGRARIAFAAAAATRQLSNFERLARGSNVGSAYRPREISTRLWLDLQSDEVDHAAWSGRLDEVMNLLPDESDTWAIKHALADDALSSLAYTIRCLLTPVPQEAAWAARRAYEAADQSAIRALTVGPRLPNLEAEIKSHRFVQRELERQQRDLSLLRSDLVDEVRQQAFVEELLTEEETVSLI